MIVCTAKPTVFSAGDTLRFKKVFVIAVSADMIVVVIASRWLMLKESE